MKARPAGDLSCAERQNGGTKSNLKWPAQTDRDDICKFSWGEATHHLHTGPRKPHSKIGVLSTEGGTLTVK